MELLLIFVKQPQLGKVKTRLAATVGDWQALCIYLKLLERTRAITYPLQCDKTVCYTPEVQHDDLWEASHYDKFRQPEGDLGERMRQAFAEGFARGYDRICIIGSDCYELTTAIVEQAWKALEDHDVVIGPSTDGGYYLLGMRQLHSELFRNKHWSTPSVYTDTIADLTTQQLRWVALPELTDIDEVADLRAMAGMKDGSTGNLKK